MNPWYRPYTQGNPKHLLEGTRETKLLSMEITLDNSPDLVFNLYSLPLPLRFAHSHSLKPNKQPNTNPSLVIFRHGTQFFRGCYSLDAWTAHATFSKLPETEWREIWRKAILHVLISKDAS